MSKWLVGYFSFQHSFALYFLDSVAEQCRNRNTTKLTNYIYRNISCPRPKKEKKGIIFASSVREGDS